MSLVTADEAKALLRWHGVHHTHGLRPDDDCEACELDAEQGETIEERARDLAHTVVAQAAAHATLRASYAQDLDGLRAELRRADDERAAWRDLRDAARAYLEARDGWQLSRVLGSTAARVTLDALDAARTRLAALVGGAS